MVSKGFGCPTLWFLRGRGRGASLWSLRGWGALLLSLEEMGGITVVSKGIGEPTLWALRGLWQGWGTLLPLPGDATFAEERQGGRPEARERCSGLSCGQEIREGVTAWWPRELRDLPQLGAGGENQEETRPAAGQRGRPLLGQAAGES